jgi:hypothetical protein
MTAAALPSPYAGVLTCQGGESLMNRSRFKEDKHKSLSESCHSAAANDSAGIYVTDPWQLPVWRDDGRGASWQRTGRRGPR